MGGQITSHTVPSSATTGQVINASVTIYNNTGVACWIGTSWDANTVWDYLWCNAGASVTLQPGQITMKSYSVTMNLYAFSSPDAGTWSMGDNRSITITNSTPPATPSAKASVQSWIYPATAAYGETVSIGASVKNIGAAGYIGLSIGGSGVNTQLYYAANETKNITYDYGMPSGGISSVIYVYHLDVDSGLWLQDANKSFVISIGTSSYPKATIYSITLPSNSQSTSNAWVPGSTTFSITCRIQNTGAAGYVRAVFTPNGCGQVIGSASTTKIATNGYFNSTAVIACPYPYSGSGQTGTIQVTAQSKTDLIDWMSDNYSLSTVIAGGYVVPSPKSQLVSIVPVPSSAPPNSAVTVAVNMKNIGPVSGYIGYGIANTGVPLAYANVAANTPYSFSFGYGMPASGNGGGTVYYYHKDTLTGAWILGGSQPWTVTAGAKTDFTITVNKTGNGTVTLSPVKTTYKAGDIVTVTATPDNGWQLANISPLSPLTVSGDTVINVTFIVAPVSIFKVGRVSKGTVAMTVIPEGTSYLSRIYISQGSVEKASSPVKVAVTSTGTPRTDDYAITWPTIAGTYDAFVEIIVGTTKVTEQIAGGVTIVA